MARKENTLSVSPGGILLNGVKVNCATGFKYECIGGGMANVTISFDIPFKNAAITNQGDKPSAIRIPVSIGDELLDEVIVAADEPDTIHVDVSDVIIDDELTELRLHVLIDGEPAEDIVFERVSPLDENRLSRRELLELALSGIEHKIGKVKYSITINPDLIDDKCYEAIELNEKRKWVKAELDALSAKEAQGGEA